MKSYYFIVLQIIIHSYKERLYHTLSKLYNAFSHSVRFFMTCGAQNHKIFGIIAVQYARREVYSMQLQRSAAFSTFRTYVVSLFAQ